MAGRGDHHRSRTRSADARALGSSPRTLAGMIDLPSIFPNECRGAVSLTYDDALDAHLDHAMPDLEAAELRGTFYIPTRRENAWRTRPDEWKAAHGRGHEIANHTQYHPCSGKHPWVLPNFRLEAYSL